MSKIETIESYAPELSIIASSTIWNAIAVKPELAKFASVGIALSAVPLSIYIARGQYQEAAQYTGKTIFVNSASMGTGALLSSGALIATVGTGGLFAIAVAAPIGFSLLWDWLYKDPPEHNIHINEFTPVDEHEYHLQAEELREAQLIVNKDTYNLERIDEAITEIAYLNRLLDLMDQNYINARAEEGPEGHLQATQEQLARVAEGEQGLSGAMSIIDIAKYISQLDPSDFAVQADWSDISSEIDRYLSGDSQQDPNTSQNTSDENITVEMDDSEGQMPTEGWEQADHSMVQAVLAAQKDGDASAVAEQANQQYQAYNSAMVSAGNSAYGIYNAALSGDGLALAQNTVNLVTSIDQAVDSYLKLEGVGDGGFLSKEMGQELGKIGASLNFAGDLIELTQSIGSGDADETHEIIDYRLAA